VALATTVIRRDGSHVRKVHALAAGEKTAVEKAVESSVEWCDQV
jgi:hypothetical protein